MIAHFLFRIVFQSKNGGVVLQMGSRAKHQKIPYKAYRKQDAEWRKVYEFADCPVVMS
jgi:hypothetical protein